MAAELVQRLKTCSAKERREVAMELARKRDDESVSELIKMVEGAERVPCPAETRYHWVSCKSHWWSRTKMRKMPYQFTPYENYDLNDQIIGIEALGETKSKRALEYLRSLAVYEITEPGQQMAAQWSDGTSIHKPIGSIYLEFSSQWRD